MLVLGIVGIVGRWEKSLLADKCASKNPVCSLPTAFFQFFNEVLVLCGCLETSMLEEFEIKLDFVKFPNIEHIMVSKIFSTLVIYIYGALSSDPNLS
jgi:hypothetical protein